MTGRCEHQPLRACQPETLAALKVHVTALLRYEACCLPICTSSLTCCAADVAAVLAPAFTPHAAAPSWHIPDRRAANPSRQQQEAP